MTDTSIPECYITIAAEEYENSDDIEYNLCHNNQYRYFLIQQYAKWLYDMYEYIRVWE
jgi:hypothetical protein